MIFKGLPIFEALYTIQFQENGKCYGDALLISSPNSDTITLCGRRNGLSLRLSDYMKNLTITFKTVNKSSGPGFSCQLTLNDQEEEAENEITEAFQGKDLSIRFSVANSDFRFRMMKCNQK